jgi:hypothetical protein
MLSIIGAIISGIGGVVQGFFGLKEKQAEVVGNAISSLERLDISQESREKAIAAVIAAEANSGYWLAAVWRPLTMVIFCGIVVAYAFGFTTPNLLVALPQGSFLYELFDLVKIGIMGYIPCRTVEKIASQINWSIVISKLLGPK